MWLMQSKRQEERRSGKEKAENGQPGKRVDGVQPHQDCSPQDTEKQKCNEVDLPLVTWFCG